MALPSRLVSTWRTPEACAHDGRGRVDVDEHRRPGGLGGRAVPVHDVGQRVGDDDVLPGVVAGQGAARAEQAVDDGDELLAGAQDDRSVA